MPKIMEFVYVMIIFLSIFVVITNVNAHIECKNDFDCPKNMCLAPRVAWCVNNKCECVLTYGPKYSTMKEKLLQKEKI
ncbi:putative Late nodulin [Medicago truncatula]|uniref:Nodule Cysteine-Rich (NCR) secreted peptide n=1 Tax=Medicago truncatula TaxID=3880 RepID=G7K8T1_MEDTR|nr:Nodule Cysteine-Rich (NCR) secreted peptide [Medicago truncatula]RHN55954.1 putative Late nodulin [Medicago truncatula]